MKEERVRCRPSYALPPPCLCCRWRLLALYLSLSSMFNTTHLRASQFALSILLVFFALTIGVGIQYFHEDYHRPITTPLSLTVVLPEP